MYIPKDADGKLLTHDCLKGDEEFFLKIDKFGGWNFEYKYIYLLHGYERHCAFSNVTFPTPEWYTRICTVGDYLWWKISPEKKEKIEQEYFRKFKAKVNSL